MPIVTNVEKAKFISHAMRRSSRDTEMAPMDAIISKKIPGSSSQDAEEVRFTLRKKYALIQLQIDLAEDADQLKKILSKF